MPAKISRGQCLSCGKEVARHIYRYCNNRCQQEYQYNLFIKKWLHGEILGLQNTGVVSGYIKRYLRKKYHDKCALCGWSVKNPTTNQVPLVADHIDGDWKNNIESNLRLLCPNCDALTPTYCGLNRNKGRTSRKLSKRVMQARILLTKLPA